MKLCEALLSLCAAVSKTRWQCRWQCFEDKTLDARAFGSLSKSFRCMAPKQKAPEPEEEVKA